MTPAALKTQAPEETRMLTPLQRELYQRDLAKIDRQITQEVRRLGPRAVASRRLTELRARRQEIAAILEASETEAKRRWAMAHYPIDNTLEIMAVPLIADVLVDLCCGIRTMLREAGVGDTLYGDICNQIRDLALKLVDMLAAGAKLGLPDLTGNDETLVEAIKKKTMSYIKQRLSLK